MEEFKSVADMVEYFVVERNKKMNGAILGEIIEIAKENEISTKICLNEKEIIKALREYMEKQNPKTNYDRIKSMGVEEMADILTYCIENLVEDISSLECLHCEEKHCTKCIKQWLLQEVSDE